LSSFDRLRMTRDRLRMTLGGVGAGSSFDRLRMTGDRLRMTSDRLSVTNLRVSGDC
jgi:hypothetical protein